MGLVKAFGWGAVLVGAAVAYHVQTRVQREGIGYGDALRQLPEQAKSLWADTQRRAALAIEDGKQAAREREQQVLRALAAAGASNTTE